MSSCLTPEELQDLTGYQRAAEQMRFLDAVNIPYRQNKTGRVLVARANAERYLGVPGITASAPAANSPNWSALDAIGVAA